MNSNINNNNNFQEYNHNYINYTHFTNNNNTIPQNSNETMIRQKYESISESMVHHKYIQNSSGDYAAADDNTVDKYLNFGDENNDHLAVKQEELECEYMQPNQMNDYHLSLCYDTAGISFITPDQASNNRTHSSSYSACSAATSSHMSIKMKRIMKREKAKSRTSLQQYQQSQPQQRQQQVYENQEIQFRQRNESAASNTTSTSSSSTIPIEVKVESTSTIYPASPSHNEDLQLKALQQQCASGLLDPKQQKKVMQMIRNRISAQNSRDRKKAYITKLENAKDEFQLETIELRQALNMTQAELNQEKNKNQLLLREINELKNKLCSSSSQLNISEHQNKSLSTVGTYQNQEDTNIAQFVVPGVVVIFNSKPISSHHGMSSKLEDLRNVSAQAQSISFSDSRLNYHSHKEIETIEIKDEPISPNTTIQEGHIDNPTVIEDDSLPFHKHHEPDYIKKDQWIQFVVPKPNHGNSHNRDDLSRDSAETDDMSHSGQSQKYMQVWAQIKSVNEFEQEN